MSFRGRDVGDGRGVSYHSSSSRSSSGHLRRPGRPTSDAAAFACRLPRDNPGLPRRGAWPRCAYRARNSPRSTGTYTRPRSHHALGRASRRTTGSPGRSRPRATHRLRRASPSAKRSTRGRARVSSSKREISSSLTAPYSSLGRMRIPRLIVIVREARTIAPCRPKEEGAKTRLLIRPALAESGVAGNADQDGHRERANWAARRSWNCWRSTSCSTMSRRALRRDRPTGSTDGVRRQQTRSDVLECW